MKLYLILLLCTILAISCTPTSYEVELTYMECGAKTDTIYFTISSRYTPSLNKGCYHVPTKGHVRCGVRSSRILTRLLNKK